MLPMAQASDWLRGLPHAVRRRFEGLHRYVLAVLDEVGLSGKLSKVAIEQIQILVFTRSLDEFLRDGSDAATAAVDAFSALGVDSFRVGSELFSGRNQAVMRGELLSTELRAAAANLGFEFDRYDGSLRQMIIALGKELSK